MYKNTQGRQQGFDGHANLIIMSWSNIGWNTVMLSNAGLRVQ